MKALVKVRPLSLSLYNHHLFPSFSFLNHSLHPLKTHLSSPVVSMATCVDTSLQEPNRSQNEDRRSCHYQNHYKPSYQDRVSRLPFNPNSKTLSPSRYPNEESESEDLWVKIVDEAKSDIESEPVLSTYYYASVLSHKGLESALANHLATKLCNASLSSSTLFELFVGVLNDDVEIVKAVEVDLKAVKERDPACLSYVHCLLNFKGFLACQAHRIAHKLWMQGRQIMALLIQNRVSEVFAVDIHPGARIGCGILLDHATGLVIGETAVIGNDVSILHNVTLGGTGKASGDRHPKIGDGVLIGAGTCILGNIKIGDGAKIGAGSVVLKDVPARTTAVGNPARLLGGKENPKRLSKIPSLTMDQTSHIHEWSDYVI